MSDEKPSLQIDTDWKRQAQAEKQKLVEQERAAAAASQAAPAEASASQASADGGGAASFEGASDVAGSRRLPPASFASLVQSIVTQALYHMGELTGRGTQTPVDLDIARHHLDTLGILEEKTRGNLSEAEKKMLDAALYETRMRFVNVATQFLGP